MAYWISFLPIIIMLIMENRRRKNQQRILIIKRKRRRIGERVKSLNTIIQELIGQNCIINTDSVGAKGIIMSVEDNWVKLGNNGKINVLNLDFVKGIQVIPDKRRRRKDEL